MSERILLVQGDNYPRVTLNATDPQGRDVGLPGAVSAVLQFYNPREQGTQVVPCEVTPETGEISFEWPDGVLDVPPGDYLGEIEITFAGGKRQTIYHPIKFKLREQRL